MWPATVRESGLAIGLAILAGGGAMAALAIAGVGDATDGAFALLVAAVQLGVGLLVLVASVALSRRELEARDRWATAALGLAAAALALLVVPGVFAVTLGFLLTAALAVAASGIWRVA